VRRNHHEFRGPHCPYCGSEARLVDSSLIYGRSYGMAWVCGNYPRCDAYVGCHKGTDKPLGRLADSRLRAAKKRAHAVFDPLWQDAHHLYEPLPEGKEGRRAVRRIHKTARTRAYAWLAHQIGVAGDACHIGEFDLEQCEATVRLCQEVTPDDIRAWHKEKKETA